MPEPSKALLQGASRGDRASIEQLIGEQQAYIYSVALSMARNPDDAADIMQEACIKLMRALPAYRAESRFTTWLYRLVVNTGLDLLRERGRAVSLVGGDQEVPLPSTDASADPAQSSERADVAARVRAALDHLPTAQRLTLTLQYFGEFRYEEIAEILGVPLNTVKSHVRRGKAALARELADLARTAV